METNIINPKRQLDLLTGALEGGSNYWYFLPDLSMIPATGYTPKTPENKKDDCRDCLVNRIWEAIQLGRQIKISDVENVNETLGYITKDGLNEAGQLMLEKYPHHLADVLKEQDDAITADVFFQLAVMKEVIYG